MLLQLVLILVIIYLVMNQGSSGSSGGFKDGFLRGVTDPIGGINDAARAIQGKTDLKKASPDTECKIKCGTCEGITETERYNWCFGIGESSVQKLGHACCAA